MQPLYAAQEHLVGAAPIAALNLVIGDTDLQDGAVEVALGTGRGHPEFLEEVVLSVVMAGVELGDPFLREGRECALAGAGERGVDGGAGGAGEFGEQGGRLLEDVAAREGEIGAAAERFGALLVRFADEEKRDAARGGGGFGQGEPGAPIGQGSIDEEGSGGSARQAGDEAAARGEAQTAKLRGEARDQRFRPGRVGAGRGEDQGGAGRVSDCDARIGLTHCGKNLRVVPAAGGIFARPFRFLQTLK